MIPSMAALAIGTIAGPPAKKTCVSSMESAFTIFMDVHFNGPHSLDSVDNVNLLLMLLKLCGVTNTPPHLWCTPEELFARMERLGLVVCNANADWTIKMELLEPFSVKDNYLEDKMRVHNSMFECLQVLKYPYLFVATFDALSQTANFDGSGMNINMTPPKIDYFSKLKPVWKALVKTNGMLLKYAGMIEWKETQWKEMVLSAVKQNCLALQYAGRKLLDDDEFLHEVFLVNGAAIWRAGFTYRFNPKFLLSAAIGIHTTTLSEEDLYKKLRLLYKDDDSDASKVNRFMEQCFTTALSDENVQLLGLDPDSVSADDTITKYVISHCKPLLLAYLQRGDLPQHVYTSDIAFGHRTKAIRPSLTEDKEFVLELVKIDGTNLHVVSDALKGDKHVVLVAANETASAILFMAPALKNDQSFVIKLVEADGLRLKYFDWRWKSDEKVVLTAVRQNGNALSYASRALKNNKDVVTAAVMQDVKALEHASDFIQGDPTIKYLCKGGVHRLHGVT